MAWSITSVTCTSDIFETNEKVGQEVYMVFLAKHSSQSPRKVMM